MASFKKLCVLSPFPTHLTSGARVEEEMKRRISRTQERLTARAAGAPGADLRWTLLDDPDAETITIHTFYTCSVFGI